MRFFTPVVFAVTAVGVGIANSTSDGNVWYLPFETVVPSLRGDLASQGNYTIATFAILAIVTGIRAARSGEES
jgi:hypothetical protein